MRRSQPPPHRSRPHGPNMQIGYRLSPSDSIAFRIASLTPSGAADREAREPMMEQPPRPAYHQHRADDAHERIKHTCLIYLPARRAKIASTRSVRPPLHGIGGPEIVVLLVGGRSGMSVVLLVVTTTEIMGMRVLVAVMVAPVSSWLLCVWEWPCPPRISSICVDDQSENRNENSLVEPDATEI